MLTATIVFAAFCVPIFALCEREDRSYFALILSVPAAAYLLARGFGL